MDPFRLNFSFPFLRPVPDAAAPQHAPWRRWWFLAALALAVHAVWMLGAAPPRPAGRPLSRLASPADDTPELLRLNRAAGSPAALPTVPLTPLPPPPPALLPKGAPAPLAVPGPVQPGLAPPPLPTRLPEAVAALRLVIAQAPGAAIATGDRDAPVAMQRRLWWLTAAQEPLVLDLWQRAAAEPAPPDGLGPLPDEIALRRSSPADRSGLGPGDWHGHTLLGRQAALLLWRQAGRWWLVRIPMPRDTSGQPGAQTLTSS